MLAGSPHVPPPLRATPPRVAGSAHHSQQSHAEHRKCNPGVVYMFLFSGFGHCRKHHHPLKYLSGSEGWSFRGRGVTTRRFCKKGGFGEFLPPLPGSHPPHAFAFLRLRLHAADVPSLRGCLRGKGTSTKTPPFGNHPFASLQGETVCGWWSHVFLSE